MPPKIVFRSRRYINDEIRNKVIFVKESKFMILECEIGYILFLLVSVCFFFHCAKLFLKSLIRIFVIKIVSCDNNSMEKIPFNYF